MLPQKVIRLLLKLAVWQSQVLEDVASGQRAGKIVQEPAQGMFMRTRALKKSPP